MSDTDGFGSGFPLYEKLVADGSNESGRDPDHEREADSITLLTRFKGHVKKELVYLPYIPRYFEALIYVLDVYSPASSLKLVLLAHSSLCYLVKRVVMQSPMFFNSSSVVEKVTTHLFMLNSIGHFDGKNFWVSSVKAFEAIYLLQPTLLAECVLQLFGLFEHGEDNAEKSKRTLRFLLVLDELLQMIKKHEKVDPGFNNRLISRLIDILNTCHEGKYEIVKLIQDIIHKNFKDQENSIRQQIFNDYVKGFLKVEENGQGTATFNVDSEINGIFDEHNIQPRQAENIPAKYSHELSNDNLAAILETLMLPFQTPKETEKNWKTRQANLLELRKILRNDFVEQNSSLFISICKDMQMFECIGKAVLSLRTTLSMTACQTFKDFLYLLINGLDLGILDQMFTILKNLLCTAKKISSTTALTCLIIMFTNVGFHQKLFHNCLMLINEKTVTARSCSSILLRIFLIKFTDSKVLDTSLIYIEEWLKKGITDAQTSVRESMRITFWFYYKGYAFSAKKFLLTQFSLQLKKAIELSIPSHLGIDFHPVAATVPASSAYGFSAIENSNRSNLHHRKYPSYAQPTHSYNASLQRSSYGRSTSEYAPSDIDPNIQSRRKASAPPPSIAKRSTTTDQQRERENPYHSNFLNESTSFENRHDIENSIQIDLTNDFSGGDSNSLITKYLNSEDNNDLKQMYQNLGTNSHIRIKQGLETLQRILLKSNNSELTNGSIDLNYLVDLIKLVMLRYPQELKPLLSVPLFCQSIPLVYVIEIHAINLVNINKDMIKNFSHNALMEAILKTFSYLDSMSNDEHVEKNAETSLHYMKYRRLVFNFCFKLLITLFDIISQNEQFDQHIFSDILLKMSALYGQEFDEQLYFDCFARFHAYDEKASISTAKKIHSTSTKLKICEELENRGQITAANLEQIMSRNDSTSITRDNPQGKNVQFDRDGNSDNVNIDDRRYLEMTMVNPFNQNRSISGGSVVHHIPGSGTQSNQEGDSISHYSKVEEPKLSEITKVISVYELPQPIVSPDPPQDVEQDSKMVSDTEENSVNLSDIFSNIPQRVDQNVKFSNAPPKVLYPETRSSSSGTSETVEEMNDEVHNISRKASLERDKSPVTPLTERQSKELSHALNNIEIGKIHGPESSVAQTGLSSELLTNTMLETAYEVKCIEKIALEDISMSSLTYYEIVNVIKMINISNDQNENFDQMKKAIARIQNRSFTIKHLNYLIGPLMLYSHEQNMKEWLETQRGYEDLLQLGKTLLTSTDETSLFPLNMASKSIVLIECLIILHKQLSDVPPLSASPIKDIWNEVLITVAKLRDYSSEIYVLLQELRNLLTQREFFNSSSVAAILSILATETEELGPGIKGTFLMETLSAILVNASHVLQKHQSAEIIQMMLLFVESKYAEWRCACFNVMANVLRYHRQISTDDKDIERQFECLSEKQYRIVVTLASC